MVEEKRQPRRPQTRGQASAAPRRNDQNIVGLALVAATILAMLMLYSITLLRMGFGLEIVASAEVGLCLLTMQVTRFLAQPDMPLPSYTGAWLLQPGKRQHDDGAA